MKQDQIYKRKAVLIKCITSWQVWSIFFSLREDWFLFMAWTLLEVNCPQSKAELRGLVTLFLLTTNLFLAHPYSFSAPTKKPMIFYFLYFHQRPFSFSDFWFFLLNPLRPLKTLLDLLSFLTPISLLESAVALRGKSGLKVGVNFSHLLVAKHLLTVSNFLRLPKRLKNIFCPVYWHLKQSSLLFLNIRFHLCNF